VEGATVTEPVNEAVQKMRIEFHCSYGWLQRCNVTCQTVGGKCSAVDVQSPDKKHGSVIPILKQYVPKDIFNMDEIQL
jgi:hypothetical protein